MAYLMHKTTMTGMSELMLRLLPKRVRLRLQVCFECDVGDEYEFFEFSPCHNTRGHKYKLFKHQTTACVRSNFFCERVVNIWNALPDDVSFDSFYRFRSSIMRINLSSHLRYCGRLS